MRNGESIKKLLSGIQPTGELHIGHYLGVLKNFAQMQDEYECRYMIANLHSLTLFYKEYEAAHRFIASILSDWLAVGIAPERSVLFVQSEVPEHAELSLILSMYTPVTWLSRNPSYKDKKKQSDYDLSNLGFLGYPVLQAADILLYGTHIVPIGEDQFPHLEITREIARRFNHFYEEDVFIIPQARLSNSPKVLGTDGRKMSKSYHNTISLVDEENTVHQKIMKMQTDPARIRRNDPGNPEVCPVFSYYRFFLPRDEEEIDEDCRSAKIGCVDCKKRISNAVVKELEPFRFKREFLKKKPKLVQEILENGNTQARRDAKEMMDKVKDKMKLTKNYSL